MQAIHSTRAGGHVGFVGVTHEVALPGMELFFSHVHLHGGPAPVRRFLPDLMDRVWAGKIQPGRVFDLELPLEQAADGTRRWTSDAPSRSSFARDRDQRDRGAPPGLLPDCEYLGDQPEPPPDATEPGSAHLGPGRDRGVPDRDRAAGHRHVRSGVPAGRRRPVGDRHPGPAHLDHLLRRHGTRAADRRTGLGPAGPTPAADRRRHGDGARVGGVRARADDHGHDGRPVRPRLRRRLGHGHRPGRDRRPRHRRPARPGAERDGRGRRHRPHRRAADRRGHPAAVALAGLVLGRRRPRRSS